MTRLDRRRLTPVPQQHAAVVSTARPLASNQQMGVQLAPAALVSDVALVVRQRRAHAWRSSPKGALLRFCSRGLKQTACLVPMVSTRPS